MICTVRILDGDERAGQGGEIQLLIVHTIFRGISGNGIGATTCKAAAQCEIIPTRSRRQSEETKQQQQRTIVSCCSCVKVLVEIKPLVNRTNCMKFFKIFFG
jgi:hypothetical protein